MCKQTKDLKNRENETDNSSFNKGISKEFSKELFISGKGTTFFIEAS